MRHGGQRCAPIRDRACIERGRQAQIIGELLRNRLADVLERFGFMRAARADDSGKNALVGVIERAAVEDPLGVATLGGIIEQRGEAARHAHSRRVFQVDGVDRLMLEAGQRFVYRIQYVSVPDDMLEVGRGGSVDHGVDVDRPLGPVAQMKVKAILTLDPVDSCVAANLAPVRYQVALDRIGKQRRKIGPR